MPGGIDEIELVGLAVARRVIEGDTLCLDCYSALTLDIHRIEHLFLHLAGRKTPTVLNKTISQSRLAMINMGNNRKIADVPEARHSPVLAES